jgi:single-stranded DNA-binding protein
MLSFTAAVEGKDEDPDAARWVRVVMFGDQAEQMAPRLTTGTRCYLEGRLSAELWMPDDGRAPRINIQVVASTIQPMGQIGRRRPRPTSRQYERARDAQAPFHDDSDLARADLQGRGR